MELVRNNVTVAGAGGRSMMFAHGFGCDQDMWAEVARAFEPDFRAILFDHVGAGRSDLSAYDLGKYGSLDGYADDVVAIGRALGLGGAVFVGHSVSAMIGALASLKAPGLFAELVMVGRRRVTSTTTRAAMSAVSVGRRSRSCWSSLPRTISAGRR